MSKELLELANAVSLLEEISGEKFDPHYGAEGIMYEISKKRQMEIGRPSSCEKCYCSNFSEQYNNPYDRSSTEAICSVRIHHFRCVKCDAVYLAKGGWGQEQ